jgi:phosphatidylserine decarboxylase
MAADERTMFEIYRETDYNRAFHCIFYTELDEHLRDAEIAKAAAGETVYTGFVADDRKEEARGVVQAIVDALNDMDEDEAGLSVEEIERRLSGFLVAAPGT